MRALLLLLIPAIAHADLRAAEQLENDGNWSMCGPAYLDAYNADQKSGDADRALFGAGSCFMRARSFGAAAHAFEQLRKGYPNSKIAPRAYPLLAQTFDIAGKFTEAAAVREEYSQKYPAEPDASDELRNAITYRIALGDNAKAIDDGRRWIKTYAAKQDVVAGRVALQIAPVSGDQEGKWLAETLQKYKLSDAERLHAMVRQAELIWAASCKGKDLCVAPIPVDKAPRCTTGERLRVDKRNNGDLAQGMFAKAKQFSEAKNVNNDPGMRHDGAIASLRLADAKLEAFLAIPQIAGLDFDPDPAKKAQKERSTKAFDAWYKQLAKDGGDATRLYEAILAMKDPEASVAAAERMGVLTRTFAVMVGTMEIPKDVRSGEFVKEKHDAFCDKMKEVSEPLIKRSEETFAICATKAIEMGVEIPAAQRCRAATGGVEPALPPLHATPPAPAFPLPAAKYAGLTGCAKVAITDDESQYYAGLVAVRCKGDARAIWSKTGTAKARAALGVLAWQHGDMTTAVGEWKQALAQDGKLGAAHYGLGVANDDPNSLANAAAVGELSGGIALALWASRQGKPGVAHLWTMHLPEDAQRIPNAVISAAEGRWLQAAEVLDGYDGALAAMHLHRADVALQRLPVAKTYDELIVHGAALLVQGKKDEARRDFDAANALDAARPEATRNLELAK